MKTAKDIILRALSYDGLGESTKGNIIFNTDYYGGKVNRHIPWCCTFIWDIFRMEGASKLFFNGKKTAYVPAVETYAKRMKKTVKKTKESLGTLHSLIFPEAVHHSISDSLLAERRTVAMLRSKETHLREWAAASQTECAWQ